MSGPKARKARLFQRAVLKNRRSERALRQEPDGAFEDDSGSRDTGARAQQSRLRAAFGDADAA